MDKTAYRVGDTVTITQEMEDEAAQTDLYVLVRGEEEIIGPAGSLAEIKRLYDKEKRLHPQAQYRVTPFTRGPFVLRRGWGNGSS